MWALPKPVALAEIFITKNGKEKLVLPNKREHINIITRLEHFCSNTKTIFRSNDDIDNKRGEALNSNPLWYKIHKQINEQ